MSSQEAPFTAKELGKAVARILNLQVGDEVEILRDKLNPNRIMVIRHPPEANSHKTAERDTPAIEKTAE